MSWDLNEAIDYYRRQGAPGDQSAVIALLREVQNEYGSIPRHVLSPISSALGVKESFLSALIRRIPGLRLDGTHLLEICAGPNCGRHKALAEYAEKLGIHVKYVPCMRLCGKGPNLRWDGTLYHRADEDLLRRLAEEET